MPTVRFQVDGVPKGQKAAAFFPTPGLTPAGSSHGMIGVTGAPGTMRVRSPKPAGAFAASPSREWMSPSDVAPDYFCPQLYLAEIENLGPPVQYLPNTSGIPDPVGNIGGVAPVAMGGRKTGGRAAMVWPRVISKWPSLFGGGGSTNGG